MHYRGHPNWQLVALTENGGVPDAMTYPSGWEALAELPTLDGDRAAAQAALHTADATRAALATELLAGAGPDQKSVGHITSAVLSPRLKKPLFLAMVRATVAAPGNTLDATLGGEPVTLTVIDLPVKEVGSK
jgi:glycine cleavage system aminomethyltransferase T